MRSVLATSFSLYKIMCNNHFWTQYRLLGVLVTCYYLPSNNSNLTWGANAVCAISLTSHRIFAERFGLRANVLHVWIQFYGVELSTLHFMTSPHGVGWNPSDNRKCDAWHTSTWWPCLVAEYTTTDKIAYCTTFLVQNWSQKWSKSLQNASRSPRFGVVSTHLSLIAWNIFCH